MKASVPRLAPLLRSDTQGRILAALYLEPERERSATDLAAIAETSVPNASRELARLVAAGYATVRQEGRSRLVRVNRDHPLFDHVAAILRYAYGPLAVLPDLVDAIAGVQEAFIFGSWAARLAGEEGPDPADIDLLLVGEAVDLDEVLTFEEAARDAVGREVNARVLSPEAWEQSADLFVAGVKSRPLARLPLAGDPA